VAFFVLVVAVSSAPGPTCGPTIQFCFAPVYNRALFETVTGKNPRGSEEVMNQVIEIIKNRRSIRSYQSTPIPRDTLLTLIEAANHAPSGMNMQPWRFVVVEDAEFRKKLLQAAVPNAKKYLEDHVRPVNPARYEVILKRYDELADPIYYGAPAMIFVIGAGPHAAESCPLACENMMLAARSLDIGSCWVKFGSMVTDDKEIVARLGLKDDEKIYGPILLGYANDVPQPPVKKAPVVAWI
jgi:nitroreductase